jgi:hypothetical protein
MLLLKLGLYLQNTNLDANADGLSLDLQFAADKTLTAREGPTPVFTRESTATYFAPSVINAAYTLGGSNFNIPDVHQVTTLSNGRYRWAGDNDTAFTYTGTAWLLSRDGETVTTSAPSNAWRPDLADWSGTGAVITPTSTFGIVRAAVNEPRFDYDTTAPNACRGLLIEESRTNLVTRSESPATSPWADTSTGSGTGTATATNNTVVSPSGINNGARLVLSARSAVTRTQQISQNQSVIGGILYTSSLWVKATTAGNVGKVVNLWQGNGATAINVISITLTNTWTRVATTGSTLQTAGVRPLMIIGRLSTSLGGPSDRTAVSFDIWGMQTEAGAFPTSYIPTNTTSVLRSADLCSITGANFTGMYNEFAGTVLCESTLNGISPSSDNHTARFGSEQNEIRMREDSGISSLSGLITADEKLAFNSSMAGSSFGVARKSAMAFQNGGSAILCLNGTLGTQDDSVFLPRGGQTPTELNLFMGQFTTVKSFHYYKKRLANEKLQSLTQLDYDPDANAYIVSLLAAGATVDTPQKNAINTFVSGEKTAGRWDKMKRLYLPVWESPVANAICMKSLTSGTFVGSVIHQAKGVVANDDGSYMNTNVSIPELGIANSYHYAALLPLGFNDNYDAIFGVIPDLYFFANDNNYIAKIEQVEISLSDAFPSGANYGILSLGGNGDIRYLKNRDSSGVSSFVNQQDFEPSSYPSNQKIFLLGRNDGNGGVNASGSFVGAFSMASELTTSEDTAYTLALKTLWETVTGFTIP